MTGRTGATTAAVVWRLTRRVITLRSARKPPVATSADRSSDPSRTDRLITLAVVRNHVGGAMIPRTARKPMTRNDTTSAEVSRVDIEETITETTDAKHIVDVQVSEDGQWIGAFAVTYASSPKYAEWQADWSSVSGTEGLYADDEPAFWLVEDATERLNDVFPETFRAIDGGPNDI